MKYKMIVIEDANPIWGDYKYTLYEEKSSWVISYWSEVYSIHKKSSTESIDKIIDDYKWLIKSNNLREEEKKKFPKEFYKEVPDEDLR